MPQELIQIGTELVLTKKQRKARNKATRKARREEKKNNRAYIRIWYFMRKMMYKCERCGEDDIGCLTFHHKDAKTKIADVSRLVGQGRTKQRILAEIQKCICLCQNCHAKEHYYKDKRVVILIEKAIKHEIKESKNDQESCLN